MEVKGTIKVIFDTVQVSEKFKKRDVVISTSEQYRQDISIQFVQDKTSILDKYKVGQSVTVGININGRSWTSPQGEVKYFHSFSRLANRRGTTASTAASTARATANNAISTACG